MEQNRAPEPLASVSEVDAWVDRMDERQPGWWMPGRIDLTRVGGHVRAVVVARYARAVLAG